MKQEKAKKSKLWLWILIAAVVLVAVAGVVLALVLGQPEQQEGPKGGRPDLYWNVDRLTYTAGSQSGLSTREPGEDGVYRVLFAYNGGQVELPIVDKQLVNFIDTLEVMTVVQDADGVVVAVIPAEDSATTVAVNAYVQKVESDKIIANSSIAMNGMQYTFALHELTEVYDVSDTASMVGEIIQPDKFQPMDTITVYANDLDEITHIYMVGHPVESAIYWRAYQMWNSSEKSTSRVPDENGVYSIDFCSNGGIVTLKCKDKSIVTSIDNKSPHSCHFGFVFDEEGYIIEIMNSGIGIRGAVAAERMEVTELDGRYFSGTQLIPSDSGLSYSATLPEDCVIYDASSAALREGRQGQIVDNLKLGDRVCVWTDATGEPIVVYIANRLVDHPAYYNLTRKYDGTKKETKREPVNGYYEFEVVETGAIGKKIVRTKDKELASFIDSIANSIVGLAVEDGIIKYAYESDDVVGWTPVYGGYIPQIQGSIISMVSFAKPDSPTNVLMNPGFKVYDVSGKDVPYGTETTLRIGDIATVTRDVSCNGVALYVTRRLVGADKIYYNLDYQYNSSTKQTKRVPDEDGWYRFTMAHQGKQVEVRTKDKDLASRIDQSPNGDLLAVMRVENGIVKELYDTGAATGRILYSGYRVTSINGDGTINVAYNKTEKTLKLAENCVYYNVSPYYTSHKGERVYSLKIGDMVAPFTDYRSEAQVIYIRNRASEYMYANKYQMYDTTLKATMRKPDADGYYWFDLAVNGEVKQFKTKDQTIANTVESYSTPFGLFLDGNEILGVNAPTYTRNVQKTGVNYWTVTSVSGRNVTTKHMLPGYGTTGDTKSFYVGSSAKVFDISPTAKNFGETAKIKKGDVLLTYLDREDNVTYVYIMLHACREKGEVGYCEHCQKTVQWTPWGGKAWDGMDNHFYLAGDLNLTRQTNIGNSTKDYGIVLDLNGKTMNVTGARGFLIRYNDSLDIIDSVGGGQIKATGINGNGGTFLMSSNGNLNIHGGTLSFVDTETANVKAGGVIHATSSTINMYGGTITGGIVNTSETNVAYIDGKIPDPAKREYNCLGGNVYLVSSAFNMFGGVIENGQAIRTASLKPTPAAQGGNLYALRNSVVNLNGGEIRGGYSNQHGGNVFISTSTLNVNGCKIYGGKADSCGGNIYDQFGGTVNMIKGEVYEGTAASGNNIYGAHDTGKYNFTGGLVTGDIHMNTATSVSVSGTPKITVGEVCGLSLPSSVKLTVGELAQGAEVSVNAAGVFSEPNANAQAYVDAGYIKPATPRTTITVENDVMIMDGEQTMCEHCGQLVTWYPWPGSTNPASGHYFIGKDFHQPTQLSIAAGTDVVLDLYGNKYTSENIRNFLIRGTLSIMDSQGGGEMITTGGEEFAGSIALIGPASGQTEPAGFNLYSGTLRLAEGHPLFNNGGLIRFSGNGELNMYGGTMIGGHVKVNGGCIDINSTATTFNMYGGLITGGTSDGAGGCVNCYGTFNMEGGVIDGEVTLPSAVKPTTISGASKIKTLELAKGVTADVSALSGDAKIGIVANGVFTKELTDAASYLQYFESADEFIDIKVLGNTLQAAVGQGYFDKLNGVHVQAEKMTADGIFANGGTVTAQCPACEQEVEWKDFNADPAAAVAEGGHYYLSADLEIASHYSIKKDFTLHLNGHNITSQARAFYAEYLNVTFMGEGTITGAATTYTFGWTGVLDVPATVHLYGGTYVSTNGGAAVCGRSNKEDTIYMYEGARIVNNGNGIGIRLFDEHDFVMYGGEITGAETNVQLQTSTASGRTVNVTIYDGSIHGGKAAKGGNIHATGAGVNLNLCGGEITDGEVYLDAAVASLLLSGKPVISNLNLTSGVKAILSGLESGAKIGVSAQGEFTEANPEAKEYLDAEYFVSAVPGNNITEKDGVLSVEADTSLCPHCGQEVIWKVWPGANSPVSGHYYIAEDFSGQSGQWSIVDGTDVVLDLQGHKYTTTGFRNFLIRGKLSILDSVGGGEMITTGAADMHGGIALIGKSGNTYPELNLYSGTLRMADQHNAPTQAGLVQIQNDATFNMYGGTVIGGEATEFGGNISATSATSTFNLYGGTVTGGKAPLGADVYVKGTFNMEGGHIDGVAQIERGAVAAKIAKDSKITKLIVGEGELVDVTGLTTGAQLGVQAAGVFTTKLTNAESYLDYFVKLLPEDNFVVVDNAISMDGETEADRRNKVHTAAEKMTADGVFANGGTVTAVCPVCGTEEQWQPLNGIANMTKIQTAGHYYLTENVENTTYYGFYANSCLHLNGKNITSTKRAVYVEATSTTMVTLNIMGEGTVSGAGDTNSRGALDIGGTINLYGGTYVSTNAANPALTARGYIGRSFVNVYDGVQFSAPEMSVLVRSQGMYIYGGAFTNGYIQLTGSSTSELNVCGGTIANANEGQTVAVTADGKYATLNLTGGRILGTVKVSGTLKAVNVSGEPVITDLDLTSGKLLTLDAMGTKADVYVTAEGAFTEALTDAQSYLGSIKAADPAYEIVAENNTLVARETAAAKGNRVHTAAEKMIADGVFAAGGEVSAVCPVCEAEVVWKDLNALLTAQGNTKITVKDHYYLSADLDLSTHLSTTVGYCLHLNGHNITSPVRTIYVEYCTVNVMGQGTVTGGFTNDKAWGAVVDAPGNMNLYGGTYTTTSTNPVVCFRSNKDHTAAIYEGATILREAANPGVAVRVYDHNDFVMYGGTITGGYIDVGGNTSGRDAKLFVYGGKLENEGKAVNASGKVVVVDICGGEIIGDVVIASNIQSVTVSGAPKLSCLDLSSGKKLTVGELNIGADITVKAADGTFTETCLKAEKFEAYFKAQAAEKVVKAESNALVIAAAE